MDKVLPVVLCLLSGIICAMAWPLVLVGTALYLLLNKFSRRDD